MKNKTKIAVVSAKRSAVGKIPGGLNFIDDVTLMSEIIKCIVKGYDNYIDEIIIGSSFPVERDNLARKALLKSGLSPEIPAYVVSKTCASSDEALICACNKIMAGNAKAVLVGGIEKVSNSAHTLAVMKDKIKKSMKNLLPSLESVKLTMNENDMTYISEIISEKYSISRRLQDEYAYESYLRAMRAQRQNLFLSEIIPITYKFNEDILTVKSDEMLDESKTWSQIAEALPMFISKGTLTFQNSAPMGDCSAAIFVMDYEYLKSEGIRPLLSVCDYVSIGVDKNKFGQAMAEAVKRLLHNNKLTKNDIGLYEINDSFASQLIFTSNILGLDMDRVNVNGGNITLGYPIGTTGMRMSVTLIHEMLRRGAEFGISVMCAGGNMADAVLFRLL